MLRPHVSGNTATPPNTILTSANLSSCNVQSNIYNEGTTATPTLSDFVPIDSFNFTGVTRLRQLKMPAEIILENAYHYARDDLATGISGASWKFVYPGLTTPTVSPNLFHLNVAPFGRW